MARKQQMTPAREKKRLVVILVIGLPLLFLTYGYFFFREQGKLEGTAWVEVPDQFVDRCVEWCKVKWDEAAGKYFSQEVAVEGPPDETIAPGSAGNLAKPPRMYGMEVPLEDHRKLVLKATQGGRLSLPGEDEEIKEVEEPAVQE